MKTKHLLLLVLATVLLSGSAIAQPAIEMFCTSNQQYVAEAKSRTWLVQAVEEDPQIIKEIGKKNPATLAKYQKDIATANETLVKVVSEHWNLTSEKPEIKTAKEIQELTKGSEGEKYALLWINRFVKVTPAPKKAQVKSKSSKPKPIKEEAILSMRLAGNGYRHIGAVNLPSAQPTEAELLVALNLLENHILLRENSSSHTAFEDGIRDNAALLKEKTLLVPKNAVPKSLTEEQLKEMYPYDVRFAEMAEIEKALTNREKDVCVIQTLPAYGGARPVNMQLVINAEDGKLLARSVPAAGVTVRGPIKDVLKKEHFQDFLEFASEQN